MVNSNNSHAEYLLLVLLFFFNPSDIPNYKGMEAFHTFSMFHGVLNMRLIEWPSLIREHLGLLVESLFSPNFEPVLGFLIFW